MTYVENKTCDVNGCNLKFRAKGLCMKHYATWKRTGDPNTETRSWKIYGCKVDKCNKKHKGYGYCSNHLRKFKKYGDPLGGLPTYDSVCIIDGCNEKHCSHGYCILHNYRFKKYGDPLLVLPFVPCIVEICCNKIFSSEYCRFHYWKVFRSKIRMDLKIKIYEYFGRECICCGEDDIDVLNLDHINNDGYKIKNNNGERLAVNYKQILDNIENGINYKEILQTLCANCNTKKHIYKNEFDRLEKLGLPPF